MTTKQIWYYRKLLDDVTELGEFYTLPLEKMLSSVNRINEKPKNVRYNLDIMRLYVFACML